MSALGSWGGACVIDKWAIVVIAHFFVLIVGGVFSDNPVRFVAVVSPFATGYAVYTECDERCVDRIIGQISHLSAITSGASGRVR